MQTQYVDTHSHIHGSEYDNDREEVIKRMQEAGVVTITVGTALESSKKAVELAELYEGIYATIGVHPTDTAEIFEEKDYEELAQSKKVVAIGECGLDYYRMDRNELGLMKEAKEKQKSSFLKQVEFAIKLNKPLMIHCRPSEGTTDAHEDMIEMLTYNQQLTTNKLRGNIHFFTGTYEIAKQYSDLGFTVSIPGVVTFSSEVAEMVKQLPLDKILSETDCPYAAPKPHRGKRNEPAYVIETVKKIAELMGVSLEEVKEAIFLNCQRIFNIGQ